MPEEDSLGKTGRGSLDPIILYRSDGDIGRVDLRLSGLRPARREYAKCDCKLRGPKSDQEPHRYKYRQRGPGACRLTERGSHEEGSASSRTCRGTSRLRWIMLGRCPLHHGEQVGAEDEVLNYAPRPGPRTYARRPDFLC